MDAEKTYSKLAILTTITATISTNATAVTIGEREILGISVSEIINAILFWDLGGGAGFYLGLVMFIATWAGFYFATKPLLLEVYGLILDNFPTSERRSRHSTTEDGKPIGMKGLALTTSFVAAQVIGQFLGFIFMAIIGGIGLFVFLWTMYYGQGAFRENFSNTVRSNEGNTEDAERAAEEAERAAEEAGREEEAAEEDTEEATEEAEAGATGDADEDAERAAEEEEAALEDLEIAVKDVDQLMEIEFDHLESTINELQQTKEEEVYEQEVIEELEEDIEVISTRLQEDLDHYKELRGSGSPEEVRKAFPVEKYMVKHPYWVENRLKDSVNLLQKLEKEVTENRRELEKEESEIEAEIREVIEAKKLLKKLRNELDEGESIDKRLEKLAKRLSDESLYEEVVYEEREEKEIEEQLQKLFELEDKIEEGLNREYEILQKLEEIENKELSEINSEEGSFRKLRERLIEYEKFAKIMLGDTTEAIYNVTENPDGKGEITPEKREETLEKFNDLLHDSSWSPIRKIVESLKNIEEAKKENEKIEDSLKNEISRALGK